MKTSATLWLADCSRDPVDGAALLSQSEQQRYAAIQHPQRRRQFLLGRLMLRHMLTRQFDRPLAHWQIAEQPQQAPCLLSTTPQPISFSIAHSRQRVACLLTSDAVAGCDIEYMGKARNILEIAALYFHGQDVQTLAALQGAEQIHTFYCLWTQHEARFKAAAPQAWCSTALWQDYCLGVALSVPSAVDVQLADFAGDALKITPLALDWAK